MATLTSTDVFETYGTIGSSVALTNGAYATVGTVEVGTNTVPDAYDSTSGATSTNWNTANTSLAFRLVVNAAAAANTVITFKFDVTADGTNYYEMDHTIAITDVAGTAEQIKFVLPRIAPSALKVRVRATTSEVGGSTITTLKVKALGPINPWTAS